jgi:hypothetical protein
MTPIPPKYPESPIRYRSDPADDFFDTPEEERAAVREFVQTTSDELSAQSAMDTLLMMAKILELRSQLRNPDSFESKWYSDVSRLVRKVISIASHLGKDAPRPDIKYEDDYLYWPEMKTH